MADGIQVDDTGIRVNDSGIVVGAAGDPCCCAEDKHCYDVWHFDCTTLTVGWVSVSCLSADPAHTGEWNWTGSVYEFIQKNGTCAGDEDCAPSETPPDPPSDYIECRTPCDECPGLQVDLYDNTNTLVITRLCPRAGDGSCGWRVGEESLALTFSSGDGGWIVDFPGFGTMPLILPDTDGSRAPRGTTPSNPEGYYAVIVGCVS